MPPRTRPLKVTAVATLPNIGQKYEKYAILYEILDQRRHQIANFFKSVLACTYVDEMAYCYDEFHVMISEITVRRWLSINRYTRKKLQCKAAEQNLMARDGWPGWHVLAVITQTNWCSSTSQLKTNVLRIEECEQPISSY